MKVVLSQQLVEHINHHTRAVQHSLGRHDRPHGLLLPDLAQLRHFLQQSHHPLQPALQPHREALEELLRHQQPVLALIFLPDCLVVLLPIHSDYM
jgi:hypothetical protein